MSRKKQNRNSPQAAFRMDEQLFDRVEKLAKATKRSRTSILEECLERAIPDMEKQLQSAVAA